MVIIFVALLSLVAGQLHAQGNASRPEFENDRIRVLRVTLKEKESRPAHDAPDTLIVCINECHVRLGKSSGQFHDVHMESGETRWIPAYKRSETNIGDEPAEIVLVEMKRTTPAAPSE